MLNNSDYYLYYYYYVVLGNGVLQNLAMVHQTPLVSCGPTLRSVSCPPGVNLFYPPSVDSKRHHTYILLKVLSYINYYHT